MPESVEPEPESTLAEIGQVSDHFDQFLGGVDRCRPNVAWIRLNLARSCRIRAELGPSRANSSGFPATVSRSMRRNPTVAESVPTPFCLRPHLRHPESRSGSALACRPSTSLQPQHGATNPAAKCLGELVVIEKNWAQLDQFWARFDDVWHADFVSGRPQLIG